MTRVHQILRNADVNPEGNGNYRAWADHTEYENYFFDGSAYKLTVNIIAENMLYQVESEGRGFNLFKEILTMGQISMQYQRSSDSLYLRMETRT